MKKARWNTIGKCGKRPKSTPAQEGLLALMIFLAASFASAQKPEIPSITRLGEGPIIAPHMDERMGSNIQGPSMIKVPDWVENPLGEYYLYFADHRGLYIRLAYADAVTGPWTVYTPGSMTLAESFFPATCPPCSGPEGYTAPVYAHIASPDVMVREDRQEIVMYLHGRDVEQQLTRLAVSKDGINFTGKEEVLGRPYFRVIKHEDYYYAMSMPGYLYRSKNGITDFELGPRFFNDDMRHNALLLRDGKLHVYWTQAGHAPERIFLSTIDMQGDWMGWQESEAVEILRPEKDYEGANLPVAPSRRGHIDERVNQLRDPGVFQDAGKTYLFYSVAGESGIGLAEIEY